MGNLSVGLCRYWANTQSLPRRLVSLVTRLGQALAAILGGMEIELQPCTVSRDLMIISVPDS